MSAYWDPEKEKMLQEHRRLLAQLHAAQNRFCVAQNAAGPFVDVGPFTGAGSYKPNPVEPPPHQDAARFAGLLVLLSPLT